MRRRTVALSALGVIGALIVLGIAAVLVFTQTDWGRERVRRLAVAQLNKAAHGRVHIGRVEGNLLGGATLVGVSITDSAGHPFIAADTIEAGYGLGSLLRKHITLSDVRLVNPVIVLNRLPGGKWNYDRIFPRDTVQHPGTGPGFGSWITLNNVTVVDGQATVRSPWAPSDTLSPVARDSLVRFALGPAERQHIERVPGGFQRVSQFRDIYGTLPLLRLADPNDPRQIIRVASLRMTAEPLRPPVVRVTNAKGEFDILHDSLYFQNVQAALAASRLSGSGRYNFDNNDLRLRLHGDTVSTNDLLWVDPAIPQDGSGKLDFALDWTGPVSDYQATNASLAVAGATMAGELGMRLDGDTMAFHDTDVRFANVDTRTIAQLFPTLRSPRQGYLTGRMAAAGDLTRMQVNGDVTFDDPRTGRSRIVAQGALGESHGVFTADDLHLQLRPVQVALGRVADPTLPVGGTVTGTLVLDGSTATRLNATGDLVHDAATGRSQVVGRVAYGAGHPPFVNADLRLEPLSLATVGQFAPAAGLVGAVSGPVRVTGPMRNLAVNASLRTPDGGAITTRGTLDLAAPEKRYDLAATASLFNARSVTTKAPPTSITANASVVGRGVDLATLDARAVAHVQASRYDSLAVDAATVRVAAANGLLTVDTLALRAPGGRANAVGTLGLTTGRTGTLRYAVLIDSLGTFTRFLPIADTGAVPPRPGILAGRATRAQADSMRVAEASAVERAVTGRPLQKFPVDTPRAIPRSELAGTVRAAGTLQGNIHTFGTTGTAAAGGLVAYGNSADTVSATYSWQNALTPASHIETRVNAINVSTAGFLFDTVTAAAGYQKPNGTIVLAVRQDSQRVYTANARFELQAARNTLFLDQMRLRFDTTVYASVRPSTLHWGPAGVDVDSLQLQTPIRRGIFVDGRIPTTGAADLHVVVTQFDVGNLVTLLQSDIPARGLVSVDLRARGTRQSPEIHGPFGITRFTYAGRPTPEAHGRLDYANQTLTTALEANREGEGPFLTERGTVPINLALAGVTGSRIPRDRQIDVTLRSDSLPLDLVPQVSTTVTDVSGRAAANFHIGGTVNHPDARGRLSLWNGSAKLVPLGITPTDIAGTIRLNGDTVVVDSIFARSGGTVRLAGGVGLGQSLSKPRFDLHLVARNARVVDNNEYGRLRADADLTMAGPFDRLDVTGDARVRQGVLYIPQSTGKTLVGAGDPALFSVLDTAVASQRALFPTTSPLLANLRMNVALAVDRGVFVRSTEANVEVYTENPLSIVMNRARQSLRVNGVVLTDRGEYQFQSRRFQILQGSATFTNTTELNPILQATAQYQVQLPGREAFNIQIIISGTLDQPTIALQSDAQPPISQTDLLSYLAFGQSSTSLLQQEGSSVVSGGTGSSNLVGAGAAFAAKQVAAAAVGSLTNQVAGQAARALGADVLDIAPADVSLDVSSFLRGTQIEFGKYIQTNTFLGLQVRPDPASLARPGFTLTHRFGPGGYSLQASLSPRYLPEQPTLSPDQNFATTSAFGLFLSRQWRY